MGRLGRGDGDNVRPDGNLNGPGGGALPPGAFPFFTWASCATPLLTSDILEQVRLNGGIAVAIVGGGLALRRPPGGRFVKVLLPPSGVFSPNYPANRPAY